jgi:hypothetical protein
METALLLQKIEKLPINFQQEVEDFVDFLSSKLLNEGELTENEKKVLDERYQAYLQDSSRTLSLETIKDKFLQKYADK